MSRRRNFARTLAAAFLLAVAAALLLLPSAPGHAQTADRLLLDNSGTSTGGIDVSSSGPHAQPFTTGENSNGYTLTSIQIWGNLTFDTAPSTSNITVTLRADSSGDPADTALATFSVPNTWTISGFNEFTLATPANLDPEKNYYIHIDASETTYLGQRAADQVNAGSAPDWSFSSRVATDSDGDWEAGIDAFIMTLHGTIKAAANTYVSNINQGSDDSWSDTLPRAQTFTTGSQSGGYTVTSVDIGYEDDAGDKFSAAIWTVDSGNEPDDGDNNNKVADLTAPTGTWSAGDTLTFTAPTGTTLDASTTYAVVFTVTSNAVRLDSTTSSDEDSGAFAGWSIADTGYFYNNNAWNAHPTGEILRIAIKGTTAAAQTGPVVWEATLTSADSWAVGNDYTYDGYGSSAFGPITTTQGSLSPDSFTVGGTTHTVELLGVREGTDNRLYLFTDTAASKSDLAGYAMEFTVDGSTTTLKVEDATAESNLGFYWADSLHSYDEDDWQAKTITVKLRTANNAATGAPTITGTAQVGETLTAVTSGVMDTDGLTSPGYTYQWVRVDGGTEADISGATSSTYTLVAADLGKTIKVTVSFSDDASNAETLTSAATAAVAAAGSDKLLLGNTGPAPNRTSVNVGSLDYTQPFETGSNATGYTLTRIQIKNPRIQTLPSTSSITVTLRADSSGDPAASALATFSVPDTWTSDALNEFTLATAYDLDPDKTYHIHVTATERVDVTRSAASQVDAGSASGWSFSTFKYQGSGGNWIASIGALAMELHGTIKATAPGAPTGLTVTEGHHAVQLDWTAPADNGGSAITGYEYSVHPATITYTATESTGTSLILDNLDDSNYPIRVRAVNAIGSGNWSDAVIGTIGPASVQIVGSGDRTFEGTDAAFTLTASRPVLSPSKPLNVSVSVSESGDMVASADEGTKTVSFALNATSARLLVPTVDDGVVESDSVVTAAIQTNTDYTVGTDGSGTVTVADNDTTDDCAADTTTTCSVSPGTPVTGDIAFIADGDRFSLSVTSGVTYRIDAEGSPTSMGTLTDPQLFLLDTSDNLIDSNDDGGTGFNARIVWTADRTGTVYVFVQSSGSAGTGTYTLTVTVAATNNAATGTPSIGGTAQVGQTLTAATGSIADADGLTNASYTYQWVRVNGSTDADISGATSSTYTLVAADQGKTIKVTVSFTDDASNAETLTSAATAVVAAAATGAVNLSATDVPVDEGEQATWTVALATQPTGTVTVTPVSDDTGAVTVRPLRLYFTTSNWDTPQTVTATAVQDADGVAETVTVSHPASGGGYAAVTAGDVTVTVTDDETPTAPGMVENLRFTTSAEQSLSFEWNPPANDGRAPITNYRYSRGAGWVTTGSADIRSGSFTGLTNGSSYDVIVQARNAVGWGATASVRGTASTETPDPISGPTSDYTWDADAQRGRLDLIWMPPVNPGWGELTYRVEMASAPAAEGLGVNLDWQVRAAAHPGGHADPARCPMVWRLEGQPCVTYSLANAAVNTDYAFRVRPENTRNGPWQYAFVSLEDQGPQIVNDNPLGVDYRIETNTSGNRIYLIYTHPIRTVDTDGYRVHRSHQGGFGSHAEYANAVGFFVDSDGNGDFDWSGNLASYGEAPERVTRRGRTVTLWLDPSIDPMDDPYVAAVRGAVVGNNGLPSPALNPMGHVKNKVRVATPPAPVMKWRYANPPVGQEQLIHVQWSMPTWGQFPQSWAEEDGWEDHYGSPDGYEVEWSADRGTTWQAVDPPHEGVEKIYAHGGLTVEEDSTFHYRVRGVNGSGAGPWSNVLGPWPPPTQQQQAGEAWTEDLSPGLQPRDLEADPTAAGNVLSWRAPWRSPEDVTGYQILRRRVDTGEQPWPIVEDTGNTGATWTDTGVEQGALYFYQVKTVRGRELSRASNYVEVYAVAVAAETTEAALTASFSADFSAHGGAGTTFVVRLTFSEAVAAGYRTLRDTAVQADQGEVRIVSRVNGSSAEWDITVAPSSDQKVLVTLSPGDGACGEPGVICTADGRKLSNYAAWVVLAPPDNTPATGAPTITGTAQVGETLTADTSGIADEDGLDNAAYTYQWLADGAAISGATDSAYTLVVDDVGKAISVTVNFSDDAGNEEESTSAATDAVEPETQEAQANTPATGAPTISGTAQVGETLTADVSGIADADGLTNATFAYQWLADGADISVATDSTYTPVVDDVGKAVSVTVTFTDAAGNEEELTSAATDAVEPETQEAQAANNPATGAPTISGTAQVGETLTADVSSIKDDDGLDKAAFAYQWQADGADISSATSDTYTLAEADEGKTISVRVTFTDDAGNEETLTSAATDAVEARPNRPATGALTITGTAQVGELLTADVSNIMDDDGLDRAAFAYQWQADGTDLSGATGSSYTLAASDEGKAISVTVSFTDNAGHEESLTSTATAAVVAAAVEDEEPTDRPHGLTAEASDGAVVLTWNAPEGYTYDYQIQRYRPELGEAEPLVYVEFTEVYGVTTYTDTEVEAGVLYVYRVTTIDFLGDAGEASSPAQIRMPATSQQAANSPATGAPTISGLAQVGETLTADTSGIADEDGLTNASFSYQWLADGADISSATGSSYTLVDSDEGKAVSVTVSFTDDRGNDETLTSAATDAVEAAPLPPLTALIENAAASHDGESVFTFELRFSEEFGLSYKTLRDHAFTVTGGAVKKAQRLEQGSDISWRITVRPNSDGQVTITLPITEDCEAQGAICTEDGRMLSTELVLTVSGP